MSFVQLLDGSELCEIWLVQVIWGKVSILEFAILSSSQYKVIGGSG